MSEAVFFRNIALAFLTFHGFLYRPIPEPSGIIHFTEIRLRNNGASSILFGNLVSFRSTNQLKNFGSLNFFNEVLNGNSRHSRRLHRTPGTQRRRNPRYDRIIRGFQYIYEIVFPQ